MSCGPACLCALTAVDDVLDPWPKAVAAVCAAYGVAVEEVRGERAKREIVQARDAVIRLLRARGWSTPRIGAFLGRDHTTVIAALRRPAVLPHEGLRNRRLGEAARRAGAAA